MKTALITGITGQDGSYLADFLLSKNYRVIGLVRRTVTPEKQKYKNVLHNLKNPNFILEFGDLVDSSVIWKILNKYKPDEVYNLAAQSHVGVSYDSPYSTLEIDAAGPLHFLEAIRHTAKDVKFYQASTSEMFGDIIGPQSEITPFSPVSPYACAKVFAHNLVVMYRKSYDLHASCGILFNHESPRRGEDFVTRKITKAAARIKQNKQDILELGNIETFRDWGFAGDYVEAMWLMLQQEQADDYVISTGHTYSVKQFVELVFDYAKLDINKHLKINKNLFRPHDVPYLLGDCTKAKNVLNWTPKVDLNQLAIMMYENDYEEELNER